MRIIRRIGEIARGGGADLGFGDLEVKSCMRIGESNGRDRLSGDWIQDRYGDWSFEGKIYEENTGLSLTGRLGGPAVSKRESLLLTGVLMERTAKKSIRGLPQVVEGKRLQVLARIRRG
ncbi:MAG: hypothetical protein ABH867_03405 [Patescibacteria group bacterium]|nr:hypothetical protein [Patescibacteria group bacterium]